MRAATENRSRRKDVEVVSPGAADESGLEGGGRAVTQDGVPYLAWLPSEVCARPTMPRGSMGIVAPQDVVVNDRRKALRGMVVPWRDAVTYGWIPDYVEPVVDNSKDRYEALQSIRHHWTPGEVVRDGDKITATVEGWGITYVMTADLSGLHPIDEQTEVASAHSLTSRSFNAARQLFAAVQKAIDEKWDAAHPPAPRPDRTEAPGQTVSLTDPAGWR